jgi:Late exocytosis, associated with Golgi transport
MLLLLSARFLRMTFIITAVSAAFAMAILFPVYATGTNNESTSTGA